MPHAAFYVVQPKERDKNDEGDVSMPHAAFYVVQPKAEESK